METPEFKQISNNEVTFEYKGRKFLLQENDRGVYGMGRAVQLYLVQDFDKKHIKEMGWTKSDGGYGSYKKSDAYIGGITTMQEIQKEVTNYIDEFI